MSLSETCGDSRALAIANSRAWGDGLLPAARATACQRRPRLSRANDHVLSIEETFTLGQELARLTMQRFQNGERGVCAPGTVHLTARDNQPRGATRLPERNRRNNCDDNNR
jgi:hypothetical protein